MGLFFGTVADGEYGEQETGLGMKANAVFIHRQYPRVALGLDCKEFALSDLQSHSRILPMNEYRICFHA